MDKKNELTVQCPVSLKRKATSSVRSWEAQTNE